MNNYIYDIEIYPNYMSVGFMSTVTKRVRLFEAYERPFNKLEIMRMSRYIHNLVGFNSLGFDDPLFTLMLDGASNTTMYNKCQMVINGNFQKWEVNKKLGVISEFTSIDLIDVAPGQASLKLYGARLNSKKLQDLPYDPTISLTKAQGKEVGLYNINDLNLTLDLYKKLQPSLNLREDIGKKYDIDVISKSDAQIAEVIFREELSVLGVKVKKGSVDKSVTYTAPGIISFYRDDLNTIVNNIEDTQIELSDNGSPILPKWLKDTNITIGDTIYNIGLGGLHSTEKGLVVIPKDDEVLQNVDVGSYYPSLIIDLQLYPKQLTNKFLKVYSGIKNMRMKAKKDGDVVTNNVLKIALNGSFGKFGNRYSFLYSPKLLLQVTFTGQLYLLMLIEDLEKHGIKVVSSNTDGVECLLKKHQQPLLKEIVTKWEKDTNMVMEYGTYDRLYARDVNNYIAIYPGGIAKAKGVYVDPEERQPILEKNVEYPIVFEAIREYLAKGVPMEDTIYNCKDVARFTVSRNVKGGAVYYDGSLTDTEEYLNYKSNQLKQNKALEKRNNEFHKSQVLSSDDTQYLGKVVRFYYADGGRSIFYKTGNKVPKSDGSKPMMDLTDNIPKDLDYDKYLELCNEHLADLGVVI